MIFYLVPAAAGRPAMLQPTQADANREARERGLKVRAPDMEHEVPTSKADLMAYVNDLMAGSAGAEEALLGSIPEPSRPTEDTGPKHMTQAEVDAMFKPSPKVADLPRDKVCELISTYGGHDLGFVAMEVAARFETLAKQQ